MVSWATKTVLTSVLVMTTSFPIFAFLSIMQFLREGRKRNQQCFRGILLNLYTVDRHQRKIEHNEKFVNLPDFGILTNTNWNLSLCK